MVLKTIMNKKKHPKAQLVVFQDISSDFSTLTRSTVTSDETIKWEDGKEYPLVKIEISSKSHPFYTGKQRIVDTENRVKNFEKKLKKKDSDSLKDKKAKRAKRRAKVREIKANKELTLKDMLKQM